ncbi:hypothetical protein MMC31_000183 [Peltigera leucophlebia]|nr:hypothetical protein [Peltigera leucophlebia]
MPYQAPNLTFGVEVEFILAFEESMLQEQLDRVGDASRIVKDLTEEHRTKLRTGGTAYAHTRRKYMGWALTSEVEPPSAGRPTPQIDPYVEAHKEFGFRAYADEISYVAQTLLPGPPDVQSIRKDGKRVEFSRWYISDDRSLLGVDKPTIIANFGSRILHVDKWDTHGVELVSRPLSATSESFDEIKQHLEPLRGTASSRHGAMITSHCALHVHVGFPDPAPGKPRNTFGLSMLQHLAYLLVMYEAQISRMHPSSRRAGSDAAMKDCITNLDEFAEASVEASYKDVDGDCFEANGELKQYNELEEPIVTPISYEISRRLIFTSDMTTAKLVKLMCGSLKDHIVNFTYLLRPAQAARTIEFRQHEGTLNPEAIRWWVSFVLGLVKLADRMADRYGADKEYAGEGYPRAENEGEARLEELWELMGFEKEGQLFYERRMESGYEDGRTATSMATLYE